MSKILATLFSAVLILALTASPSLAVPREYVVQEGDTLSAIAKKFKVPGGFERLHYVNKKKVEHADLIEVGQRLTIPTKNGKKVPYEPVVVEAPAPEEATWSEESSTPSGSGSVSYSSAPSSSSGTLTVTSTAYCLTGTMANGQAVYDGAVAMNGVPLGAQYEVLSGPYAGSVLTVADRIGHGSSFDIAMPGRCDDAIAYGRRTIQVRRR